MYDIKSGSQPKLEVTVRREDGLVFAGLAKAVSSTNEIGPFDILAFHANFVCTIRDYLQIHLDTFRKDLEINSGILRVKDNKVEIYLGV